MSDETEAPRKPPFIVAADEPDEEPEPARAAAEAEPAQADAEDDETRFPVWVKVPDGLKFPAGVSIWFVPLQTRLMRKKTGGEPLKMKDGTTRSCRQIIFWELNLEDQRRAFQRAGGDPNRAADELALQTIRAVDGHPVDWTSESSPHHPRRIWADMGPKLRNLMHRLYTANHVLADKEVEDFFVNCVDVKKTV